MKKIFIFLFTTCVLLFVLVVIFHNAILKAAVDYGVTHITGFKTETESLKLDLPGTLEIRGLKIQNPDGFENRVFAEIPHILVQLNLKEILSQTRIHLYQVVLNVEQVNIEKNAQGVSNVSLLSSVGGKGSAKKAEEKPAPEKAGTAMPFLLEHLDLTIHQVSYSDHTGIVAGAAPVKQIGKLLPGTLQAGAVVPKTVSTNLNVNHEIFENVQDPKALVNIILLKIVKGTTFGKLMGLRPDMLEKSVVNALGSGKELLAKGGAEALQQGNRLFSDTASNVAGLASPKKLTEAAGSSVSGAMNAMGQTAQSTQQNIKNLFSKPKPAT